MDAFLFSVCSAGCYIRAMCEQFCTFNGSDAETPSSPSEASKTSQSLHIVTVHIHHIVTAGANMEELVVWAY